MEGQGLCRAGAIRGCHVPRVAAGAQRSGPRLALRDTGNYVTGAAWHYKRDDQADTCCDPNPGMSGHNRD